MTLSTLLTLLTLLTLPTLLTGPPTVILIGGATFRFELVEMRAHVFARRGHQRRIETIIDGIRNRLHGRVALAECGDYLALARFPVLEIALQERGRIPRRIAVGRQENPRLE